MIYACKASRWPARSSECVLLCDCEAGSCSSAAFMLAAQSTCLGKYRLLLTLAGWRSTSSSRAPGQLTLGDGGGGGRCSKAPQQQWLRGRGATLWLTRVAERERASERASEWVRWTRRSETMKQADVLPLTKLIYRALLANDTHCRECPSKQKIYTECRKH